MKQVVQIARGGRLAVRSVPAPQVRPGHLLVRTRASLISAGTERMALGFARKGLAGKARADLVRKVLGKARRDGLAATARAVTARLDEPMPLGYSATGEVIAVGAGLEGAFHVGERVAIAGAGLANHAELNVVPRNLVAPVPASVADEHACFATVAAIALHAVRNLGVGLGDVVAVIGVGLVGQLAVQQLSLAGARVLAVDTDPDRRDLAGRMGAEAAAEPSGAEDTATALTNGRGCDAVLIAAATESSAPFTLAAELARDRARVCLVGLTGTAFPYAAFMKKELNVVVSRSYGPGRYDPDYEGRGLAYPAGWVRWTETENLAECLRLMASARGGRLDVAPLITHRFPLDEAERAYRMIVDGQEPHLGVVLLYPDSAADTAAPTPLLSPPAAAARATGSCVLGVIGAGAFAKSVLLPELKRLRGVKLRALATHQGAAAEQARKAFGFETAATDADAVLADPQVTAVLIATRHDSHAELAARALAAGKSVLVEKPLALDRAQLNQVVDARNASSAFFQVGFNRRFAPMAMRMRERLAQTQPPRFVVMRVNAGAVPRDSWIQAPDEGGGRILGEVCHFVDLARFLVGAPIASVQAEAATALDGPCDDVSVQIRFADGSLATIAYTALGDTAYGKERIEAYAGGAVITIEDFHALTVVEDGKVNADSRGSRDKGIAAALRAFADAVSTGGPPPMDEAELVETGLATIAILESLRSGSRVSL